MSDCPKCGKKIVHPDDWGDYDDACEWACRCPEAKGDCYIANGKYIFDVFMSKGLKCPELQDVLICHGDVIGAKGSPVEGQQFDHCWIELSGDIILDMSNGKKVCGRIDSIKQRIVEGTVTRYTPEELVKMIAKHEHWGPWE